MTVSRKYSAEWEADCLRWRGKVLNGEKAHWCWDWDCLPVDETTPEFAACTCYASPPSNPLVHPAAAG